MKISKFSFLAILALGTLMNLGSLAMAEDAAPKKAQTDRPEGKGPGGPGGNPQERFKKMAEELGLTEDQKEKLQPILKEQGEKMREIFQDQNLSREEKMPKLKEIREGFTAKIKAILTPEQQEKYEKMVKEMQNRRKQEQK